MQDRWTIGGVSRDDGAPIASATARRDRRAPNWPVILSFVVGLVAVGAIGASVWVYVETGRDARRMASEIAQIKVSLELFARNQTTGGGASAALTELQTRLSVLETSWRNGQGSTAALPGLGSAAPAAAPQTGAANQDDCLPPGTRFMVTAGDRYPVCGTSGTLDVLSVGDVDIAFADGTAIGIGGMTVLPGTNCTIAVLSANADGLSGYGEIRVNC